MNPFLFIPIHNYNGFNIRKLCLFHLRLVCLFQSQCFFVFINFHIMLRRSLKLILFLPLDVVILVGLLDFHLDVSENFAKQFLFLLLCNLVPWNRNMDYLLLVLIFFCNLVGIFITVTDGVRHHFIMITIRLLLDQLFQQQSYSVFIFFENFPVSFLNWIELILRQDLLNHRL